MVLMGPPVQRRVIHRPEAASPVGARRSIPAVAPRALHEAPAEPGGGAWRWVSTALCRRSAPGRWSGSRNASQALGRAGAVDDAGLGPERIGEERGKVPDPGAEVVTSGAPPTIPALPWATGVGVTSGAACEPAANPAKGGRASVPTRWVRGPFGLALAKAAASSAWRCSSISRSMRLSKAWA